MNSVTRKLFKLPRLVTIPTIDEHPNYSNCPPEFGSLIALISVPISRYLHLRGGISITYDIELIIARHG